MSNILTGQSPNFKSAAEEAHWLAGKPTRGELVTAIDKVEEHTQARFTELQKDFQKRMLEMSGNLLHILQEEMGRMGNAIQFSLTQTRLLGQQTSAIYEVLSEVLPEFKIKGDAELVRIERFMEFLESIFKDGEKSALPFRTHLDMIREWNSNPENKQVTAEHFNLPRRIMENYDQFTREEKIAIGKEFGMDLHDKILDFVPPPETPDLKTAEVSEVPS